MKRKIILVIFICISLILSSCNFKDTQKIQIRESNNSERNEKGNVQEKPPLRFAIASILSLKESQLTYYKLVKYLEMKLNYPIEIVQKQTYNEVKKMFEDGNVDIGLVCAYLSYLGENDHVLTNVAIPVVDGSNKFTSYIITQKDSQISSLKDLRGHTFAFTDPFSYSGYIAAKHQIKKEGQGFKRFFSKTYYTYSHDNSIFSVANGLVDGAAVHSMVYDNLVKVDDELVKNTKVITEGVLVGNPPIVVHTDLDKQIAQNIKSILLGMHNDPEGMKVLEELNIDSFDLPNEELYEPITAILKEID